jgi:hypothetical protein
MQRTNLLPFIILAVLLSPLVYALSLFYWHSPVQDWFWYLSYYIVLLAGPFLIGYGMIVYPHKQHRLLAWVGFVVGGVLTGYFLWMGVATYFRNNWGIILPGPF